MRLTKAKPSDCRILWIWRNDPEVRKNSFDTKHLPYKSHKAWFEKALKDANIKIFIVEKKIKGKNKKIGMTRIDSERERGEINIIISKAQRGKGYGLRAIKKVSLYGINKLGLSVIAANIKKRNKASIKAFAKAGFVIKEKEGNKITMEFKQ